MSARTGPTKDRPFGVNGYVHVVDGTTRPEAKVILTHGGSISILIARTKATWIHFKDE